MAKDITSIIIIHDTVLTSDAKQNMTNSCDNTVFYQFEVFTFDELSYDIFETLFENPEDETNIKILDKSFKQTNVNKLPIILSSDPLARYLRIRQGDIVEGRFGDCSISLRRCIV